MGKIYLTECNKVSSLPDEYPISIISCPGRGRRFPDTIQTCYLQGGFINYNILLMQLVSRRFFCTSSPYSLKNILEKEVIPANKESISPPI